jgi:hypothetical protein
MDGGGPANNEQQSYRVMITKIADLLNELRIAEAERIDQQQIKHTTTIGDMYEGLTASVLERAIPPEGRFKNCLGIRRNEFWRDVRSD